MKKKRGNNKSKARLGVRQHIKHKSKLTLLLILKLALATLILILVGKYVYLQLSSVVGVLFAFLISFAAMCLLYLFLVVKVLNLLKFK